MTEPGSDLTGTRSYRSSMAQPFRSSAPANLADILERVLDKGIVIAGDIVVNILDIELLTLKVRLFISSADTAREMGLDWWRNDPMLSTSAQGLAEENRRLRERVEALELESGNLADEEETEEDTEGETEVRAGVPDR